MIEPEPTRDHLPARMREPGRIGVPERVVSMFAGASLTLLGASRRSLGGLALGALGGYALYRATTGKCIAARWVRDDEPQLGRGVVTIHRPLRELFAQLRSFQIVPQGMPEIASVTRSGDLVHWVAATPGGEHYAWDTRIVEENDGESIAWCTYEGPLYHAATIQLERAPVGRGTEVRFTLEEGARRGHASRSLASPQVRVARALRRWKQLCEAGELATIEGQPAGSRSGVLAGAVREREKIESAPTGVPVEPRRAFELGGRG